jgi:hypothetical protein
VQGVGGQLVGVDVIAKRTISGAVGQQVSDEVMQLLLRPCDVLGTVQGRGQSGASVFGDQGVRLEDTL